MSIVELIVFAVVIWIIWIEIIKPIESFFLIHVIDKNRYLDLLLLEERFIDKEGYKTGARLREMITLEGGGLHLRVSDFYKDMMTLRNEKAIVIFPPLEDLTTSSGPTKKNILKCDIFITPEYKERILTWRRLMMDIKKYTTNDGEDDDV